MQDLSELYNKSINLFMRFPKVHGGADNSVRMFCAYPSDRRAHHLSDILILVVQSVQQRLNYAWKVASPQYLKLRSKLKLFTGKINSLDCIYRYIYERKRDDLYLVNPYSRTQSCPGRVSPSC